jgi:transposase
MRPNLRELTANQHSAAEMLGVSIKTLQRWRDQSQGWARKLYKRVARFMKAVIGASGR